MPKTPERHARSPTRSFSDQSKMEKSKQVLANISHVSYWLGASRPLHQMQWVFKPFSIIYTAQVPNSRETFSLKVLANTGILTPPKFKLTLLSSGDTERHLSIYILGMEPPFATFAIYSTISCVQKNRLEGWWYLPALHLSKNASAPITHCD